MDMVGEPMTVPSDAASEGFAAMSVGKHSSIAAGVMALWIIASAISPAVGGGFRGTGISQSWEKTNQLIAAIKNHLLTCSEVTEKQTDLSRQCSDEKTDLLSQQQKLGISDSLINERLNAEGPASPPRWP
jgi:hypothetical protein